MIVIDIRHNRKKIFIALLMIFIAGCIFLTYRYAAPTAGLIREEIQYKDYSGYGGKFTYKLPADWKTSEQKFQGKEILYHNDFISGDKKLVGYVQLWDLNLPIKEFIEEGKKSAGDIVNFKDYSIEPVKINGKNGYILQYTREVEKGKYVKAFEVFVMDKGNTFHRFAFYMDEKSWEQGYRMLFLNIASTANLQ